MPEARLWHLERQSQTIGIMPTRRRLLLTFYNGWRYKKRIERGELPNPLRPGSSVMRVLVFSHGHPLFSKGGGEIAAYNLFRAFNESKDVGGVVLCARGSLAVERELAGCPRLANANSCWWVRLRWTS